MDDISESEKEYYYVVYWYPTIFHREKQKLEGIKYSFEDVSDKADMPLKVKKTENGKSLTYTLLFEDTGREISFDLTYVDERKNGFTIYKYDRVDLRKKLKEEIKEGLINSIQNNTYPIKKEYLESALEHYNEDVLDKYIDQIFISCYHSAKDLYHKHEIQDSSDGRLKAYLKNKGTKEYLTIKPDISTPNHEAISFFIEQYETLFREYAQTVSKKYSEVKTTLSNYLMRERKKITSKKEAITILNNLDGLVSAIEHVPAPLSEDGGSVPLQSGDEFFLDEEFLKNIKERVEQEEKEETKWQNNNRKGNIRHDYSGKSLKQLKRNIWEKEDRIAKNFVDSLNSLQGICGNALTEYNYCKSLLESKYNTEYKYDLQLTDDEVKQLGEKNNIPEKLKAKDYHRKCAFNIRNSIRYIVEVRNKCDVWENEIIRDLVQKVDMMQQTAEESNIQSKRMEYVSLSLGVVSILLGALSFFPEIKSCVSNCNHNHSDSTQSVIHTAHTDSCTITPIVTVSSTDKPEGLR